MVGMLIKEVVQEPPVVQGCLAPILGRSSYKRVTGLEPATFSLGS
jgi:hypothetical protein